MSDAPKRFENWEQVDCNECSHYWDSSCDGVSKGHRKPCASYSATRSVVIPARIKALEKRVKWLNVGAIFGSLAMILHLISHLLGWE